MMTVALSSLSYVLILLYGSFLSISFAGGFTTKKERMPAFIVISFILCIQIILGLNFGIDFATKLYPLITHLPLILLLIIVFKKPTGIAVISVLMAYFYCQLPRWIATIVAYFFQARTAYLIAYIFSIIILFFLLREYFAKPAYLVMTYSRQSLFLATCLPLIYYLFDYATTIYTDILYTNIRMISEFLPAFMALFYLLFVVLYHDEVQRKNKIELNNTMLEMQLEQAASHIHNIKKTQELSRIYRHDMRHHLSLIDALLKNGDLDKVKGYLKITQADLGSFTPHYYCRNEIVNLILSTFIAKASKEEVQLSIDADLPESLPISETELCAIFSNGLENAINSAKNVVLEKRIVKVYCCINKENLLLHVKNPYEGEVIIKDGLPQSTKYGHGFGVRSIELLTKKYDGYCSFSTEANYFSLKVVLPLKKYNI